jgi:dye decolorizing peroxidase
VSLTRRQLLGGAAVGLGGAVVGVGAGAAVASSAEDAPDSTTYGQQTVPFFGAHQSGIQTPAQAYAVFSAYDLGAEADLASVARMMRLLSDDAARLTQGVPALADLDEELALSPSRLTVTFGFGPRFFDIINRPEQRPSSCAQLPSFSIDALQDKWSGGDLLIQICGDDAMAVSHARRMLWKDTRAFAIKRWQQNGFLDARGSQQPGATPRNLMGQVDGTTNPRTDDDFDVTVWNQDPPSWFVGGTMLAIRRIAMNLETWDAVSRADRENSIGRRLANGSPLTGRDEFDALDLSAVDDRGLPVISDFAHVRRAHTGPQAPFLRRGYNYDLGTTAGGVTDAGHVFTAYAANLDTQFIPVQQTLADQDLLNVWTTPIGSAVFALPPGASAGGWVGEGLLG